MPLTRKFTTVTTGDTNQRPVAVMATQKVSALIGSIIQLDGRNSYDPEGAPIAQWTWRFVQVPIGSEVENVGFKDIRPLSSAVSFIPDKIGVYVIELVVNDGELDSDPITATVTIQLSRVPIGENLVPDAHFLWSYISNFWDLVEDREKITAIWSATIQSIGSELIKLWGADLNKSLETAQSTFQRRWQPIYMKTSLQEEYDQRIIVGKTDSGTGGTSGSIGRVPGIENTKVFYLPLGEVGDVTRTNFTRMNVNYGAKGRVILINGEGYTIRRTTNENLSLESGDNMATTVGTGNVSSAGATFLTSGVVPGDVLMVRTGVDAGQYLVDSVPSETSISVTYMNGTAVLFTGSTAAVFDVVRPYSVVIADEEAIPDGQVNVNWRVPNLLHVPSMNFEDIGVSTGDVVVFEVTRKDIGLSAELRAQVVGVDRSRLGFEFSLEDLEYDGEEVMDRGSIQQLVQDLKIVPPESSTSNILGAAEAFISFIPTAINLNTRPFSTFRIVFKAKEIIHNTKVVPAEEGDTLVSVPVLQEDLIDPPVVLRENLDYVVEENRIEFISNLFTPADPAPTILWAEAAYYDNNETIENNFGRMVNFTREDLTNRRTRAPYLSAVKGLFYALTNGPSVANVRLGLQILLGLPFAEERGLVLEIQPNFSTDVDGSPLGRILIEDVDDNDNVEGVRRFYYYPVDVGLEVNPTTGVEYVPGDIVERWAPLSKGVEVVDYVKDPNWWRRTFSGLEILKFFTFKATIDGEIFDVDDVSFAYEFIKAIKPGYTNIIATALLTLEDDLDPEDFIGGAVSARFFDNNWGLEAVNRPNHDNGQGVILWRAGSRPFHTRSLKQLRDVTTFQDGAQVKVQSTQGWDSSLVRGRTTIGSKVLEGDILVILQGYPGAFSYAPAFYEIDEVTDDHNLILLATAPVTDRVTLAYVPLDTFAFVYGDGIRASIVRRHSNPMFIGEDLVTTLVDNIAESASASFRDLGVATGDHLIIESGANFGEYIIDAVDPFDPGPPIHPPTINDDQVRIERSDGGSPALVALTNQTFRIIQPYMQSKIVGGTYYPTTGGPPQPWGGQSIWTGTRIELEVLDPELGTPLDVFTPGMVGLLINVSGSENSGNDGEHIITGYLNSGRVALELSPSTSSDATAQAVIHF